MATGIRARLERLEQQHGGMEPLFVELRRCEEFEGGFDGVSVNGVITDCAEGQSADDLTEQIIAEIRRERKAGIFVIKKTKRFIAACETLTEAEWEQKHCSGEA